MYGLKCLNSQHLFSQYNIHKHTCEWENDSKKKWTCMQVKSNAYNDNAKCPRMFGAKEKM